MTVSVLIPSRERPELLVRGIDSLGPGQRLRCDQPARRYASHWLRGYRDFLARVTELGELRTLDEVAAEVTLDGSA